MSQNKLVNVIEGAVLLVLGILVAINGWAAMDKYFGIVGIAGGAILALLALAICFKTKVLPFGFLALGGALLAVGIALVADKLSLEAVLWITIYASIGLGAALAVFGLYVILARKSLGLGIAFLVIAAILIILPIVYINVNDFRDVFWVIVGIAMAVYGGLIIVLTLLDKKLIESK